MGDPLLTPALMGAAVSLLVAKVIDVAQRAYHCKEQCKFLRETLQGISPLVDKVVQNADRGNATCCKWLSDFQALLGDAESVTEECARTSWMSVNKLRKLSSRIRSIHQKIKDKANPADIVILDGVQDVKAIVEDVRASLAVAMPQHVPRSPEFVMQPVPRKIVAFQANPFDKLKKLIMDAADAMDSPTTLGLKGRGGAGKTTVAQMLHNDPEILAKYGAGSILWMTIGHDVGDVESVQVILGKFLNDREFESWDHADRSVEDRHAYIMQAFRRKRVLLILDDVWDLQRGGRDMMHWLDVAQAPGSVTLITTRNGAILDRAVAKEKVAVLILSEGESWELFCHYAFPSASALPDRCESGITKVAWEVCKECKGLPLALRVIGSAMRGKDRIEQWRHAVGRLRASEGLSNCKFMDGDLFGRLRYSYDELDEDTKKCFLYFAAFPEDYEIPVEDLIAMWRAEELFGPDIVGDDVDDAGWTLLLDLEMRSLIELGWHRGWGPQRARVHDILRDLACYIIRDARPGEWASECFFEPGKVLVTPSRVRETVKRMSFMEGGVALGALHVPNLRVCLVRRSAKVDERDEMDLPGNFFSNMKDLRYLDMSGCRSVKFIPEDIKELASLTHLDLFNTKLERLPEGMKALTALTHLYLGRTKLEKLPEGIKELTALTYLDLSRTRLQELPEGIWNLMSLTYLNLQGTKLERLSKGFKGLKTIRL